MRRQGCRPVGSPSTPRRRSDWRRRSSHDGNGGRSGTTSARLRTTLGGLAVERAEESDDLYLLFRDGDATVKVRDGVLDVKGLLAVDDDGLEQWVPVGKHPFPVSRDDLAAALARLGVVAPPLARETYTAEQLLDEVVPADRRAARRHGAQAAHPLHGRRRDGRALRAPDRRGLHALARDRVRGPRARAGGGPLARPRGARERVHGPGAEGADQLRAGALRGHRRRHQLGQAPRRRAPRRRHVERGRRPRDRHPARRGPRRDPAPSGPSRWTGRWRRSRRWPRRRARPARPRSPPSAPQGCARRRTPPRSSAPPRLAAASGSRSSPARRRAASPTSRPRRGSACLPARSRSSTPAGAARSSPSATRTRSGSSSACPSARCA